LVIATGGLGPTQDDITKEVAAQFFNRPLFLHEESLANIQARFARMGHTVVPENNRKQALLPEGCLVLPNNHGSAPGMIIKQDTRTLILLPGPPNELEPMFLEQAVPFLRAQSKLVFISRVIKTSGMGESAMEIALKDLIESQTNPTLALYAKVSEVWLRLTASAESEAAARALIKPVAEAVYDKLGPLVYGEDDETLASAAVGLLKQRNMKIACAESCTGGLLTAALVDVPGVSDVLPESWVSYSNEAKVKRLAVDENIIKAHGAVSAETASAMAEGAARQAGVSAGLSTTGIAGPEGGTDKKPVGLVYIGLYIEGRDTQTKELRLSGHRQTIRRRAVAMALDFLRRNLIEK
jgi:nicotinamide-nucleotide amidase